MTDPFDDWSDLKLERKLCEYEGVTTRQITPAYLDLLVGDARDIFDACIDRYEKHRPRLRDCEQADGAPIREFEEGDRVEFVYNDEGKWGVCEIVRIPYPYSVTGAVVIDVGENDIHVGGDARVRPADEASVPRDSDDEQLTVADCEPGEWVECVEDPDHMVAKVQELRTTCFGGTWVDVEDREERHYSLPPDAPVRRVDPPGEPDPDEAIPEGWEVDDCPGPKRARATRGVWELNVWKPLGLDGWRAKLESSLCDTPSDAVAEARAAHEEAFDPDLFDGGDDD